MQNQTVLKPFYGDLNPRSISDGWLTVRVTRMMCCLVLRGSVALKQKRFWPDYDTKKCSVFHRTALSTLFYLTLIVWLCTYSPQLFVFIYTPVVGCLVMLDVDLLTFWPQKSFWGRSCRSHISQHKTIQPSKSFSSKSLSLKVLL